MGHHIFQLPPKSSMGEAAEKALDQQNTQASDHRTPYLTAGLGANKKQQIDLLRSIAQQLKCALLTHYHEQQQINNQQLVQTLLEERDQSLLSDAGRALFATEVIWHYRKVCERKGLQPQLSDRVLLCLSQLVRFNAKYIPLLKIKTGAVLLEKMHNSHRRLTQHSQHLKPKWYLAEPLVKKKHQALQRFITQLDATLKHEHDTSLTELKTIRNSILGTISTHRMPIRRAIADICLLIAGIGILIAIGFAAATCGRRFLLFSQAPTRSKQLVADSVAAFEKCKAEITTMNANSNSTSTTLSRL